MVEKQLPDGSRMQQTDQETRTEMGQMAWRFCKVPPVPESALTEGEKWLAKKMQSEAETGTALAAASYESLFDLPVEGSVRPYFG